MALFLEMQNPTFQRHFHKNKDGFMWFLALLRQNGLEEKEMCRVDIDKQCLIFFWYMANKRFL